MVFISGLFCGIHFRAISQEIHNISVMDYCLKITNFILQPHLPGVNELISDMRDVRWAPDNRWNPPEISTNPNGLTIFSENKTCLGRCRLKYNIMLCFLVKIFYKEMFWKCFYSIKNRITTRSCVKRFAGLFSSNDFWILFQYQFYHTQHIWHMTKLKSKYYVGTIISYL